MLPPELSALIPWFGFFVLGKTFLNEGKTKTMMMMQTQKKNEVKSIHIAAAAAAAAAGAVATSALYSSCKLNLSARYFDSPE